MHLTMASAKSKTVLPLYADMTKIAIILSKFGHFNSNQFEDSIQDACEASMQHVISLL